MEFHREEKREEGDHSDQKENGGWWSRGERQIQPVISSLSGLHRPQYPQSFTELGREETGEGGGRGDLGEKRRVIRRRGNQAVVTLLSKNGY